MELLPLVGAMVSTPLTTQKIHGQMACGRYRHTIAWLKRLFHVLLRQKHLHSQYEATIT